MGDESEGRRGRGRKSAIFGHARRELIPKNPSPLSSEAESGPIIHMCTLLAGKKRMSYLDPLVLVSAPGLVTRVREGSAAGAKSGWNGVCFDFEGRVE